MSLFKAGKVDEAEPLLRQALAAAEREQGAESPSVARILNQLGHLENARHNYADAEPLFQRAIAIGEKRAGKNDSNLAGVCLGLGSSYAGQGKYAEAAAAFQRSLALAEKSYGPDDARVASILSGYAPVLRKMGKDEEADQMEARARTIRGEPEAAPAADGSSKPSAVPTPTRFEQAEAAHGRGDFAAAEKTFRELAEAGDAHAQAVLGDMYIHGEGVPKDPAAAARWYRKSADQGYPGGEINLGVCYEKGMGVPKDLAEAAKWYRKAADQGDAGAQSFVGDMYAKGLGVPKDWKEADSWFAKAAAGGDQKARNLMVIPAAQRKAAYEQAQQGKSSVDMALRAVELQDWLVALHWAVPKGVHVTLGDEEVTPENGTAVVARLEKEQRDLAASMEKAGFPSIAGDYVLSEPAKDKCPAFQGKTLPYPVKVAIVQNKNAIELKSPEMNGCGVVVGKLVVMKTQGCGGSSTMRLLGAVSDNGIDDLSFLEAANAPGLCRLGDLTRAPGTK